jgi:hypothetical protein
MQTLKFLALPTVALVLWLGATAFTVSRLGDMAQSTAQLQQRGELASPTMATASR